jgi:RimJ/RimL family protein N-acetyltransferase
VLLYGADKEVSEWVSDQLFNVSGMFENSTAIGLVKNNKLIAGTVYNNFKTLPNDDPHIIEMSIATIDKRWATKAYLKAIFSYPFTDLGVRRVQILTSTANEGINDLVFRLGFIKEGTLKSAHISGDGYLWRMLKDECRWING